MNQDSPLRIAVVGAGQMGKNHLKVYADRSDVKLVGIVDSNVANGFKVSQDYQCPILALEALPGKVDAVSVATPSSTHYKVASYLLKNGIDCLVEKPLAMNVEQCKSLVDLAAKEKRVLLVGHVEEYNSGFLYLKEALEKSGEKPKIITSQRFNYGSKRIQDTDVVLDLMIHDLGCVVGLLGKDAPHLEVLSAHGLGQNPLSVDVAVANLRCKDCFITLQASRMSHHRHREFSLHTNNFTYLLNFVSQQVSVFRQSQLTAQTNHIWSSPLEDEIDHFLELVKDGGKAPLTSGLKSSVAIKFVMEIQKKIYEQNPMDRFFFD